jgi:hypothetical protein
MKTMKYTMFAILLILLIVFWPLAVIWSMNTLFPTLGIPYNLYTWLAVAVITATFKSNYDAKK